MTEPAKHSVSVAGVIVNDEGQVLLIRRRDNGHWEPPGGVLEISESILDGLRREVLEETGLRIEPVALTGVYKNMDLGVVALVFRCRQVSGQPVTNHEVDDFRLATRSELDSLMSPAFSIRLKDAIDFSGNPAIREHDGNRLM